MNGRLFSQWWLAAVATAGLVASGSITAAAQTPTVLRGSNSTEAFSGTTGGPVVLRGTTPPPSPATAASVEPAPCAPGYVLDPSAGCVAASGAFEAYDYDLFYGYPLLEPRRRLRRHFAGLRASPPRPVAAAAPSLGRVAHDGFGRR
jgi:hypothetical protein